MADDGGPLIAIAGLGLLGITGYFVYLILQKGGFKFEIPGIIPAPIPTPIPTPTPTPTSFPKRISQNCVQTTATNYVHTSLSCHDGWQDANGTSCENASANWVSKWSCTPTVPPTTTSEILNYIASNCNTSDDSFGFGGRLSNLQWMTWTISEEMVEAQTDPWTAAEIDSDFKIDEGWWGKDIGGFESTRAIGDVPCQGAAMTYPDGLTVKGYWSNRHNNCIAPGVSVKTKAPSKEAPALTFHGGRVVPHPVINLIFWGSEWNTQTNPSRNDIIVAVRDKLLGTDKQYFSELNQYGGCGAPTFGTAITVTNVAYPSNNILNFDSDAFFQAVITNPINSGQLPKTNLANQFYVILVRKNTPIYPSPVYYPDITVRGFRTGFRAAFPHAARAYHTNTNADYVIETI